MPQRWATSFLDDVLGDAPLGEAAAAAVGMARVRLNRAAAAAAVNSLRLMVGGPVRGVRMEVLPLARTSAPHSSRADARSAWIRCSYLVERGSFMSMDLHGGFPTRATAAP